MGEVGERAVDPVDRAGDLGRADPGGNADAGEDADDGEDDQGAAASHVIVFDRSAHHFEILLVEVDQLVDVGLKLLAVAAVGVVVALFVGGGDRHLGAEPGGLGPEGLEILGLGDHVAEFVLTVVRHARRPFAQQRVDRFQILRNALGERFGHLGVLGRVDAARVHHHRGNQPVEMLAVIGALGGHLKSVDLFVVSLHETDTEQCHADGDDAQQGKRSNKAFLGFSFSRFRKRRQSRQGWPTTPQHRNISIAE